jgi:hypothetical protein
MAAAGSPGIRTCTSWRRPPRSSRLVRRA